MALTKDDVVEALRQVEDPELGMDIVDLGLLYDVEIDGKKNSSAAWYYPDPKPAAKQIKDYVAFWRGVRIEK